MDSIEVTRNSIRITKANGISTAQINRILQGIKQFHSFPVESNNGNANAACDQHTDTVTKKLTVALEC